MPSASASVTRPDDATAYTAADVIGPTSGSSALEFAKVCSPDGGDIIIETASLLIEAAALIASEAAYTLHLFSVTPPSALADNAGFLLAAGDRASYLGSIDLGTPVDVGSSLFVQTTPRKQVRAVSGSIYGYLVTAAGYTPTALRVHTVTLDIRKP